jgi:hypothetical protein
MAEQKEICKPHVTDVRTILKKPRAGALVGTGQPSSTYRSETETPFIKCASIMVSSQAFGAFESGLWSFVPQALICTLDVIPLSDSQRFIPTQFLEKIAGIEDVETYL